MRRAEAVVFDIGNVLIGWQPEAFYDRLIGPERCRALFAEVDLDDMNARVDRGAPFGESVLAMRDAHPEWASEIQVWHDRWIEMLTPVIAENVALLQTLKAQGMPVFALSNFGVQTFAWAQARHDFLHAFDHVVISGDHGVMKPEPEIYALIEDATGMAGAHLYFIDDKPENVDAARARGWQGHVYSDHQALIRDMVTAGLAM